MQTLDQILEATGALLVETGYEGVNTNAVAARAGVKPPAVYRYFPNKVALYLALARKLQAELDVRLDAAFAASAEDTLEGLISRLIDTAADFWLERPAFGALWHGEWSIQGDPSPAQSFADGTLARLMAASAAFRGLGPERERLVLATAMQMTIALIDYAVRAPAQDRPALLAEARRAVAGYLLPIQAALR